MNRGRGDGRASECWWSVGGAVIGMKHDTLFPGGKWHLEALVREAQ